MIRDWRGIEASRLVQLANGGELWQSGAPQPLGSVAHHGFDLLVLCARELQPDAGDLQALAVAYPTLATHSVPMDDVEDEAELVARLPVVTAAAQRVASLVALGRRVLVTCVVGRNRSGLVSALAIRQLLGVSGGAAAMGVKVHRRKELPGSEEALSNRVFYDYLCSLGRPL